MKKEPYMFFVFSLIVVANAILAVPGTYRVCTGVGNWQVQQVDSPYVYKRAVVVPRFFPDNPWDSGSYHVPRPWYKLYLRDDAYWISWSDSLTGPPGWGADMWAYSPIFKMYDNISRATIWISADDAVDAVILRNVEDSSWVDLDISVPYPGRFRLRRFDVTDAFRSCSAGGSHPPHQLEFYVNDYNNCIGLIAYMSYDFYEETGGTEPITYTYLLTSAGYRRITMPFYALEPSPGVEPTLNNLFSEVHLRRAWVYNDSTGEVNQPIDIDAPLRGQVGDSVRTFSLEVEVHPDFPPVAVEIEGWPVFEQRYLDFNNNNCLWFGTVNPPSPIRFDGNRPDDYPNGKINGDRTWKYQDADGDTVPENPTDFIYARYAYKTDPVAGPYTLPYSLDIDAGYGFYARSSFSDGKPTDPVPFDHAGPEFDWLYSADTIYPSVEDTAALLAYYEGLRRIELLPGLGGSHPDFTPKKNTEEPLIPKKFGISVNPTPFNSEVSISVMVPEENNLSIKILDNTGNFVRDIYNGYVTSGVRTFDWNGTDNRGIDSPSGIYYIKAIFDGKTYNAKAVLLK